MNIKWYTSLESTNTTAKELRSELLLPICIAAHEQTKGRGRRDNLWESQANQNITATIVKKVTYFDVFKFLMEASLSVIETLKDYGINAWIKPPNDIYVNNKKIAGILIETIHEHSIYCFTGIGLNVNQDTFNEAKATSMVSENANAYDIEEILTCLLNHIESLTHLNRTDLYHAYNQAIAFERLYTIYDKKAFPIKEITKNFTVIIESEELDWSSVVFHVKD